jgi:hypothetical protein
VLWTLCMYQVTGKKVRVMEPWNWAGDDPEPLLRKASEALTAWAKECLGTYDGRHNWKVVVELSAWPLLEPRHVEGRQPPDGWPRLLTSAPKSAAPGSGTSSSATDTKTA